MAPPGFMKQSRACILHMTIFDSDHPFIGAVYWLLRRVVSVFVNIAWMRSVSGLENIPRDRAAILAFNHQSFLDFICFASTSPRNVHFLAAEKFFRRPFSRALMRLTGQIKVERNVDDKSSVYEAVARHVEKDMLIGIFPEGTRSPYRDEMLKAFTGVAQFALKHHIPVIPVGIRGTYDLLPKHERYPKLARAVDIRIGDPLYFDAYHDKHSDREICVSVTEVVMSKIELLSGKSYPYFANHV